MAVDLKFRKDIDGLRGIAVLAVVLFHSGLEFASGGYIGVDVFFVISGFLITQSIQSNINKNRFSVLKFYERRILRIFPAAITVLIVTGFFGFNILFPEELKELLESIFYFLQFRSNFWASESISYFGISTEFKPLIHLWSLSIELQFYVFLPLILSPFLLRNKRNTLIIICLALLTFSFLYAHLYVGENINKGYFSSLMRVWQFALGVTLRLVIVHRNRSGMGLAFKDFLTGCGILMVVISVYIFDQRSNFPGIRALLPCIGAVLILAFGDERTFFGKCLSTFWLRSIGIVSFSLYLVHQPIFAYYRVINGRKLESVESVFLILVSLIVAGVLYFLIEKPFQSRSKLLKIFSHSYVFFLFSLTCIVSYKGINGDLTKHNITAEVSELLKFRYDNNPRLRECRVSNRAMVPRQACLYGDPSLPQVALWGDSHADQLVFPLSQEFNKYGHSILEFSIAGCPPIINIKSPQGHRFCSENAKVILEYLSNNDEIEHVFLHAYWIGYLDKNLIFPEKEDGNNLSDLELLELSFKTVLKTLIESGKKVHLIYPVPQMKVNPPLFLARNKLLAHSSNQVIIGLTQSEFETQSKQSIRFLDEAIEGLTINSIYINDFLFDTKSSKYIAVNGKSILYRDDNHLSLTGAGYISKPIALKAFGALNESD